MAGLTGLHRWIGALVLLLAAVVPAGAQQLSDRPAPLAEPSKLVLGYTLLKTVMR